MALYHTEFAQSIFQPLPERLHDDEKVVLHARVDPLIFLDFAPFPGLIFKILGYDYHVDTVIYEHLSEHSSGCDKRFTLNMVPKIHLPEDLRSNCSLTENELVSRFHKDLNERFDTVVPAEVAFGKYNQKIERTNGEGVEYKDGIISVGGFWIRREPLSAVPETILDALMAEMHGY